MITFEQFRQQAAEGHHRIPVVREVLSDLDTPLSVYLKLADGPHTYLFESVEGGERFGRYSIIGLPARRIYSFRGHTLEVSELGEVVERREVADPLAEVERLRTAHKVPQLDGLPGVGPVTAQRILAWREAHGRFTRVDELAEVEGIGAKTLERLTPLVRV